MGKKEKKISDRRKIKREKKNSMEERKTRKKMIGGKNTK